MRIVQFWGSEHLKVCKQRAIRQLNLSRPILKCRRRTTVILKSEPVRKHVEYSAAYYDAPGAAATGTATTTWSGPAAA